MVFFKVIGLSSGVITDGKCQRKLVAVCQLENIGLFLVFDVIPGVEITK